MIFGAAVPAGRGFQHGQRQPGDSQSAGLDNVLLQVAAAYSDPARPRPWLLRGTVTSSSLGSKAISPSHHAAVRPVAAAMGPWLQTAARMRAAVLNGRSSAK